MRIDEFQKYVDKWKEETLKYLELELKESVKYNQGIVDGLKKEGWQDKNDSEIYIKSKAWVDSAKETKRKQIAQVERDAMRLVVEFLIAREGRSNAL